MQLPAEVPEPAEAGAVAEISAAAQPAIASEPVVAAAPSPGDGNTILVVDDDPDVRQLLQRHLSREGFQVLTAAGGEEGLRLARQVRPRAITLDVMMPGMDGWAVLTALKKDPELATIPVLLCTILDDRGMGFALGASEFLTKPIDRNHLVALLRDMKDEFVTFEIDNRGSETMVFPHKEMLAAIDDILTDNGVRSQGSADVMEVWNSKPTK